MFISSLARPDRDERWLDDQRRALPADVVVREYPLTAEQALASGGDRYFDASDVDAADVDALGLGPARSFISRRGKTSTFPHAIGVDIGFRRDATAIVVIQASDEGLDVVDYRYVKGVTLTEVQTHIEQVAASYPGPIVIENDPAGFAVMETLNIPSNRLRRFRTTAKSKAKILENLNAELHLERIKWPHRDCPELTAEMYACRIGKHTGDTVMALALAVEGTRQLEELVTTPLRVMFV